MRRSWSHRGENATADLSVMPSGYMSAIAGISYQKGKELIEIQDNAVNGDDFAQYVMALLEIHDSSKIAIFMDNLSVHHTPDNKKLFEELGLEVIFNKPYCPDYNPIECVFSNVKNHYKRARFHFENNSVEYELQSLIEKAFASVKLSSIRNDINHSMRLLGMQDVDSVFPKVATQ